MSRGVRPPRRRARLLALASALATCGGLATSGAETDGRIGVRLERLAASGADLAVDLRIANLIDQPTEAILERGVPITLILEIELWRERAAWFDRLEASRHLGYKLQLDAWDEVYIVRDAGGRQEVFLDLAEARSALEVRRDLNLAPLSTLREDQSYYLVVNAAVKPLTVEDIEELEGWLSGEIKSGRGIGLLGLPRALFGLVLDITGFKDRNDVLRTPSFRRAEVTGSPSGREPPLPD